MSYLRGLVRKARAPRPQIEPQRAPPAPQPSFDFADVVQDEVVVASRQAATAPAAQAALRPPTARFAADAAPIEPAHSLVRAALHDDVPATRHERAATEQAAQRADAAAGQATPREPPEAPSALQRTVSRRTPTIRRRTADPALQGPRLERAVEAALAADLDTDALVPMRSPRLKARGPAPWRDTRPAAVAAPPPPDRDSFRPDVHISIGRLEVRANVTAPAKPERPAPFRPRLTLEDYLASRSRGQ